MSSFTIDYNKIKYKKSVDASEIVLIKVRTRWTKETNVKVFVIKEDKK